MLQSKCETLLGKKRAPPGRRTRKRRLAFASIVVSDDAAAQIIAGAGRRHVARLSLDAEFFEQPAMNSRASGKASGHRSMPSPQPAANVISSCSRAVI